MGQRPAQYVFSRHVEQKLVAVFVRCTTDANNLGQVERFWLTDVRIRGIATSDVMTTSASTACR